MPTKLWELIDDCPRTHRFIGIEFCKQTQCLYFEGRMQKLGISCKHPKAEPVPKEVAKFRIDILAKVLKSKQKEEAKK